MSIVSAASLSDIILESRQVHEDCNAVCGQGGHTVCYKVINGGSPTLTKCT